MDQKGNAGKDDGSGGVLLAMADKCGKHEPHGDGEADITGGGDEVKAEEY